MTPVFFTDRDLGKQFPEKLRVAGIPVEPHHVHFEHNTPDDIWLAEVGRRGWYSLTHNSRIRYTPNEVQAVFEHRVGLFVIIGKAPFADLAGNFVATYGKVLRFIERHNRPFIAKIYRPHSKQSIVARPRQGIVDLWLDSLD